MLTFLSCKGVKQPLSQPEEDSKTVAGVAALAPAMVYKTYKDYSSYVPVILNAEKNGIVSYPAPSDVFYKGSLAYPTPLAKGYLLDNRGIGLNVAFLDYTYEAYAALKEAPDAKTLLGHIIDRNPLRELWNCGPRTGNSHEVERLNALIEKGFPECRQLVDNVTLEK